VNCLVPDQFGLLGRSQCTIFREILDLPAHPEWWKQHNKEIKFAFRVLAALGLTESTVLQDDKELERERQELEAAGDGPLESITWTVTPSKDLMRLYRQELSKYLCERDKRLSRKYWGR
jgi:hypothetical protein